MDLEFSFGDSPWEQLKDTLRRGDKLSAVRFLSVLEDMDDESAEEAALELEEMGVLLDDSVLTTVAQGKTQVRLQREQELVRENALDRLEENDPLRIYLQEVAMQGVCEDPQALANLASQGDEEAQQQLTQGCLHLVVERAKEKTGRGVLLLDLCQEGSLGLWQSVLQYESGDFLRQAAWWIESAMARRIVLQARENGVGENLRAALERYRKADKELLARLGHNPTREEMALELGITPEETENLEKILENVQLLYSAQQPREPEAEEEEKAVEDTAYFQMRQRVEGLMSLLEERDAQILRLRFGLEGGKPLGPVEIGNMLGLTPEEILRREAKALEKMRTERGE